MTVPASIATGGHATDAEIVDAQNAINILLGLYTSSVHSVASGGTGIGSYTAGDILYASAVAVLSKLAKGTTTQVLHSGTTPSWSAVDLVNDITSTLAEAHGGTNQTTYARGDTLAASAANTLGKVTVGASDTYWRSNGTDPAYFLNPAAEYTTTAAQSIPTGIITIINYGTSVKDTDNAMTTGSGYNSATGAWTTPPKFTCPTNKGGDYLVTANATYNTAPGINPSLFLYKNGTRTHDMFGVVASAADGAGTTVAGSAIVTLAAGDTLDVRGFQNSGGNVALSTNAFGNRIFIKRLG